MNQVEAGKLILNQAAHVSASPGVWKAKRIGGDERIIRPRAPDRKYRDD